MRSLTNRQGDVLSDWPDHSPPFPIAANGRTGQAVYLVTKLLWCPVIPTACTDARVVRLDFCAYPGRPVNRNKLAYTFDESQIRLVPHAIEARRRAVRNLQSAEVLWLSDLIDEHCYINANPTGSQILREVHNNQCPIPCADGWVPGRLLNDIVPGYERPSRLEARAVCPVCMGRPLMRRHQALRVAADTEDVDEESLEEFYERFNTLARFRGYAIEDIDSDEYRIMLSAEDLGFEPAAEEAISNLPLETYKPGAGFGNGCSVCREDFKIGEAVIKLQCGHSFCGSGCIQTWLHRQGTCPNCRKEV